MSQRKVLEDMVNMENAYRKAQALRAAANDLIVDVIPEEYKHGDVKYVTNPVFKKIKALFDEALAIETELKYKHKDSTKVGLKSFTYKGPYGNIDIRNAKDLLGGY